MKSVYRQRLDRNGKPHRDGFTLIELLVVISIIALLISILLPALGSARTTAVMLQCQSRVRTIGQATHMYMADNSTFYPWQLDGVGDPSYVLRWAGVLNDYMGGERTFVASRNTEAWHCPDVYEDAQRVYGIGNSGGMYGPNPWIYNRRLGGGAPQPGYDNPDYPAQQIKEAFIDELSSLVMVEDARAPWSWPPYTDQYHNWSANYRQLFPHFGVVQWYQVGTTTAFNGVGSDNSFPGPGLMGAVFADGHGGTLKAVDFVSQTSGMDSWRAINP